ncbi:MAG: helix-turn-helix domain-containing protein [Agathobacter sp.]|nr:helix-turn-helix domain-containing protein [Agathobacter sp.]
MTLDELCKSLCIGRNAAYNLLNKREIKAFRIGRCWKIPRSSVNEYILRQSHLNIS